MIVFNTIKNLQATLTKDREKGKIIGFVPTMGALHAGHLTLARHSLATCQRTVFMIFVNPKQFCSDEDFSSYPRSLVKDVALLAKVGVDYCFAPSVEEIWSEGHETFVDMDQLSRVLLGKQRPGHFRGVATILAKTFNIIGANKAFFGEKDFQQLIIVRRMVKDLAFPVEIVGVPTCRDPDGVASSSRNLLLTAEDRKAAVVIPQSWRAVERLYHAGERSSKRLLEVARKVLEKEKRGKIEIIDLRNVETFANVEEAIKKPTVLILAVRFGKIQLIDQHILGSNASCIYTTE
ncbi:MAG: pantoate--beta-alanine ligase [Candidatus Tokpelaia sp. JSC085]|nr:MAG: pantoate--beta-alanine ligase [Candidatus Tokpelaia sp. JSC085]